MSNLCIRCGNERITSRTWKEAVQIYGGTSTIVHKECVCPDPACQKKVEAQFLAQRAKRESFEKEKELEKQKRAHRSARAKLRKPN